jgi:pimeloyl-ACP methyl ester carboxylesterase
MAAPLAWQESHIPVAGLPLRLRRAGPRGAPPLLVLHRDSGTPDQLPIHAALAERYDLLLPEHPGYGQSERAPWMRHPRDLVAIYQGLLAALDIPRASLLGLGFGGWIAAEMASLAPRDFERLILVGPMGIKPPQGDILDQALVSHTDYARAGFHDQAAFAAVYGAEPSTDQLVEWDLCREMNFRLAWKPYMHSQTLPHLLGSIEAPTLVVWGAEDRVVPISAADRVMAGLRGARLAVVPACGACVEMEKPAEFARLVTDFIG